jgi:hypothetical protein
MRILHQLLDLFFPSDVADFAASPSASIVLALLASGSGSGGCAFLNHDAVAESAGSGEAHQTQVLGCATCASRSGWQLYGDLLRTHVSGSQVPVLRHFRSNETLADSGRINLSGDLPGAVLSSVEVCDSGCEYTISGSDNGRGSANRLRDVNIPARRLLRWPLDIVARGRALDTQRGLDDRVGGRLQRNAEDDGNDDKEFGEHVGRCV